ncbi:MAG: MqnA/MqnD/SBP family protein [Planctomycetota bacterium]
MTTTAPASTRTLRLGHSPDPDDAFMWWPLADFVGPDGARYTPQIDAGPYRFEHVLEDIESLNQRCERAELEITALSIHQYPFVADRYALTACGSSMGDGYGPMLVAKPGKLTPTGAEPQPNPAALDDPDQLKGLRIAIPGQRTTAFLTFQLLLRDYGLSVDDLHVDFVPFDQVLDRVASDDFDAGVIIHEGQLTWAEHGVVPAVDLGAWWKATRGLPLPLGGNAIRRDLADHLQPICQVLKRSIDFALENREDAIRFALQYGRGLDAQTADQFVGMYVNRWTLDYGPVGRQAVQQLLTEAVDAGLVPALPDVGLNFIAAE